MPRNAQGVRAPSAFAPFTSVAAPLAPRLIHLQYRHQYGNTTDSHPLVTHLGTISEPGSTTCTPGTCFTVNLIDSYGDGWNGNVLTIVDVATGETLDELTQSSSYIPSGVPESFDFCTPCGLCFTGSVGGGSYTHETSWEILDMSGAVVASASNDGAAEWCSGCSSTICGVGQQPNAADDGCEPCEAGYYSDANGNQPCAPCAPGASGT